MRRVKQRGFTLLEMMVALSVLALIGLMGNQLLSGMLRMQQSAESRVTRLEEMQRLIALIENDLAHSLFALGPAQTLPPEIVFKSGQGPLVLSLVRRKTLLNPSPAQTALESVEWRYQGKVLQRLIGGSPLSATPVTSRVTARFDKAEQLMLRFWHKGHWVSGWAGSSEMPAAVEISFTDPHYGKIEKIVLLNGVSEG